MGKNTLISLYNKQFLIKEGDLISVPYNPLYKTTGTLVLKKILMFKGSECFVFGNPYVCFLKSKVFLKIVKSYKEKNLILKKNKRKGFQKRLGFSKKFITIQVLKIN
ncbi:MAG: bL21 family ribosomal protein [Candidatus Organicella extenuata]|jgi:ribosomal protein L21|uniref:50S ribosomal protein L21 n=1 Tax=Candidatus Organicella extenuata TaxID=2841811 RepID=A0AA51BKU5_9BACT|nr:MAG: bL21 family ribosomal protein [Candidatus Organicella extenuata]